MNRDRFTKRQKTASLKDKRLYTFGLIIFVLCLLSIVLCPSCKTEAPWTTKDVNITMEVKTVSAGFIECEFSTNKEAYYLIAIEPARTDYDPMAHQKEFMMLALDSANVEYIQWRNWLLKSGETNIAPFASHALQYGKVNHFFTNLEPSTDYWVFAFVVNPDKLQPAGKLYLARLKTKAESTVNVFFEYRVRGYWDYIYPVDSTGHIYDHFPYMCATRDSLEILEDVPESERSTVQLDTVALWYFSDYFEAFMKPGVDVSPLLNYGVKAVENDGWNSYLQFEVGHTYYTAIVGWDGEMGNNVIYKFTWTGEDFEAYFKNEDSFIYDWYDE